MAIGFVQLALVDLVVILLQHILIMIIDDHLIFPIENYRDT